jgi:site-specific DNA recombinase
LGHIYLDAGFSGASKNRPAFQQMLRDARAGAFDVIVCWKSDRLSRGLCPAAPLLEAVEGTGITLESVKDSIDLNTFSMLAAVGKIQLSDMSHRARMGHQGNAKKEKILSPPYGYSLGEDDRPVIDTDQAEVVRRIFAMYTRDGASFQQIADTLNREGMVTRRDCRWSKQTVAIIIGNSAYIGKGSGGRHVYK